LSAAVNPSDVLEEFLALAAAKKLTLYPAQEEAILQLYDGANVILNTPTGSGKSLVAQALHFLSLKSGTRSYYTCPIKALVNEKFLALCQEFGPEQVGMITGDATVNAEAPIICCTAEILSNLALREGERAKVADVIMDEFHYYSDRERGVAWQVPLLAMPQTRFLLMSATLGDTTFFERALTALNGRRTELVRSTDRPVPLDFSYQEIPLHETITQFIAKGRAPIYIVNFTQRECAEEAQNLMSMDFCTKEEKRAIAEALIGTRFDSPYGKEIQKLLRHGVGLHHAGLLPKYRVLVEKLAQRGLLKIICGTDTLGVGVNIPIRTVLFTKLCKYDGQKTGLLSVRDFHQISGRAGRKGFDDHGYVTVQAPEHIIENLRLEEKSTQGGKAKKFVRRKPPEKGYVPWNEDTLKRLLSSAPEPLVSQFTLTHGMLLNVLSRQFEDGCRAVQRLIRVSHEPAPSKKKLRKHGFALFRSLVERQIVEFVATSSWRKRIELNLDLQQDFSLNQALSLYLLDTLKLLDPEDPQFSLNVLSLAESILENPELILRKQVDRLKTEKLIELKMAGVEYDQRMEELEKIEHPKPLREFIYNSFNAFADKHPWVGVENIRPKSVAREMFEGFYSFADYVREYELQRAEGILLRYLSETYKVLLQTVPETLRTEEVDELITYLRGILRATDSSLVEEWERLRNPQAVPEIAAPVEDTTRHLPMAALARDRGFRVQLRNLVFQVLRAFANGDVETAGGVVALAGSPADFRPSLDAYFAEHARMDLSPDARNPALMKLVSGEGGGSPLAKRAPWLVEQTLRDAEGPVSWRLNFELEPAASEAAQAPVLKLLGLERF
jgi:superfamily II RNA helicase